MAANFPWNRGKSNTTKSKPSSGGFVDRHPGTGGSGQQSAFSSSYKPSPKFGGTPSSNRQPGFNIANNKPPSSSSNNTSITTNYSDRRSGSGGNGSGDTRFGGNLEISNSGKPPTIVVHNNEGDSHKGTSGTDTESNWEFGSITTKGNTYLNTENEEVMSVYRKINRLKLLNPTWTDLEAANYLNYGTTDRKYNGTRGKTANSGSQDILDEDGLMNTWGTGIRGDYNFGKAMDVGSYSNGLDWVTANANQMSTEDIKIQRAILDGTKPFKKPSKFAEFFKDMPSLLNAALQLKNMQPTRESFDTEIGSAGWDAIAQRQLKRGELMPDGSNPYNYLKNHEGFTTERFTDGTENYTRQGISFKDLAAKYSMVKESDYKPMSWWKERHLSPEEVAKRNAEFPGADMFYEENLVGVDDSWGGNERYEEQRAELNKKIKQELNNNEIDIVDGIKVDGDIVKLNETFQKGPHLNSNDNEIKESVYNYQNNTYNSNDEEGTTPDDGKKSTSTTKYLDPASRAGGFEALFGIPYSPLGKIEPDDIKTHLESNMFAGRSYTWDASLGKYRVFDEAKGLSYITPEEARLELDLSEVNTLGGI